MNFDELSWKGSLVVKIVVLGIGVLFVYWAGWPQPAGQTGSLQSSFQTNVPSSSTIGRIQSGSAGLLQEAVSIPLRGEEKGTLIYPVTNGDNGPTGAVTAFIVDLNDGTSAEFEHLPGIGAVLAERIVAHRAAHGAFRRVEDLMRVPGIGEKRFQQIRPFVAVRGSTSESGMGCSMQNVYTAWLIR
jgi:competence protein ComEA